jgi:hypothetical protein
MCVGCGPIAKEVKGAILRLSHWILLQKLSPAGPQEQEM